MANTGTVYSLSTYEGRQLVLRWTQELHIDTNSSTIRWTLSAEGGTSNYYSTGPTEVKINNVVVYTHPRQDWDTEVFPAAKGSVSGTLEVTHNDDGTKQLPVNLKTAIYESTVRSRTVSFWLDPVQTDVNISSAPNFNDEQNPTVGYINQAGDTAKSLTLSIISSDGTTTFATRDPSKTGTTYTFSLTSTERNAIRTAATNTNSLTVKFRLEAVVGSKTLYHEITKTCTIINATPTINATVTAVADSVATAVTGNSDTLIRHYSKVNYTFSATALKNATITTKKVTCGSQWNTANSGTFEQIDSGTFVFEVVDSRGNTTTHTINKSLVNYNRLTCNLEISAPSTDGDLHFNISGHYWAGNFGAVSNTLTIQYRYKINEGEYGNWTTVNPTISNGTYDVGVDLTGMNYLNAYRFQARAIDKLTTAESGHIPVKTRPIFDWGENDFNFNCPVTITDGYLKYPLMGIINAMTKTYPCTVSIAAGDNYTSVEGSASICGNMLRCYISATRSTAYSGDGANEVVGYVSINHGEKISGMLNVSFANGSAGAVSSLYTSNVSQTSETIDFTVNLAAVAGSSTRINSYFIIPIIINLDKFVEE